MLSKCDWIMSYFTQDEPRLTWDQSFRTPEIVHRFRLRDLNSLCKSCYDHVRVNNSKFAMSWMARRLMSEQISNCSRILAKILDFELGSYHLLLSREQRAVLLTMSPTRHSLDPCSCCQTSLFSVPTLSRLLRNPNVFVCYVSSRQPGL